jgi:ring-1,2-phenylacetyl-CoA epoxidase subunit PaaC
VSQATLSQGLVRYVLSLGDDALVLAQRLGEWATKAPAIEEDVALLNIALDLLGQARSLLTYAGELEGAGRSEDDLAFLREERDFFNCQLVELPNGDFAVTMVRQLLFSSYQYELYEALCNCADPTLAAIAAKAVKEVAYHREHASTWVARLGDGTEESHDRTQSALEAVWPFAVDLFESDAPRPPGLNLPDPAGLRNRWRSHVDAVLAEATLSAPESSWTPTGGRRGLHTESFGFLLAEMQHLHRSYPRATW